MTGTDRSVPRERYIPVLDDRNLSESGGGGMEGGEERVIRLISFTLAQIKRFPVRKEFAYKVSHEQTENRY